MDDRIVFFGGGDAPALIETPLQGTSSSHDPNFSREAAFLFYAKAASPRKWVSGGAPTLPFDSRAQGVGSLIDEVAARVSFTVETTVLPSCSPQVPG